VTNKHYIILQMYIIPILSFQEFDYWSL